MPGNQAERKAAQLCAQIRRALSLVLAGDFGDERLHQLVVWDVEPAPDATRLLVTVGSMDSMDAERVEEAYQALRRVRGQIRRELAQEIHRKRVPELVFRVVASWTEEP